MSQELADAAESLLAPLDDALGIMADIACAASTDTSACLNVVDGTRDYLRTQRDSVIPNIIAPGDDPERAAQKLADMAEQIPRLIANVETTLRDLSWFTMAAEIAGLTADVVAGLGDLARSAGAVVKEAAAPFGLGFGLALGLGVYLLVKPYLPRA